MPGQTRQVLIPGFKELLRLAVVQALADLFDALFKVGLAAPMGHVAVGRCVNRENAARPADRHAPFTANLVHQSALAGRPKVFRRSTS